MVQYTKSWNKAEEKRKLKMKINEARSETSREITFIIHVLVRRDWANRIAREAKVVASYGNMKGVYEATKNYATTNSEILIWQKIKKKNRNLLIKMTK